MDIQQLVHLSEELRREAAAHADLGWGPVGGECRKDEVAVTAELLERFRDHLLGGIGFEMSVDYWPGGRSALWSSVGKPLNLDAATVEELRRLTRDEFARERRFVDRNYPACRELWLRAIADEDTMGGVMVPLAVDEDSGETGRTVVCSRHSLRLARRVLALREVFERFLKPRLRLPDGLRTGLEIGGGHGRTARNLLDAGLVKRMIITDLPLNMIITARYLGHHFGDGVQVVMRKGQPIDPSRTVLIIAPWLLSELKEPVDIAVNFLSFQHMGRTALTWYAEAIAGLHTPAVFHWNRFQTKDPTDVALTDYPLRRFYTPFCHRFVFRSSWSVIDDGKQVARSADIREELLLRRGRA